MSVPLSRNGKDVRQAANQAMTLVIIFLTGVIPLMLGGNRPAAWAATSSVVFLALTAYLFILAWVGVGPRKRVQDDAIVVSLFCILGFYMVFQIAPILELLPNWLVRLPLMPKFLRTISLAPSETFFSLMRWLTYGAVYFLALQVGARSSRVRFLLLSIFSIVVAHAVYAMLLFYEFDDAILVFIPKWAYQGSFTGAFVNRNSFATFLAMGAVLGVAQIAELRSGRVPHALKLTLQPFRQVLLSIGVVIILTCLIGTGSRMGVLSAICGICVTIFLGRAKQSSLSMKSVLIASTTMVFIFGAISYLYGSLLFQRLLNSAEDGAIRWSFYKQVTGMIVNRPLTGYGGGSFEFAYPLFHNLSVSSDTVWEKTHNSYLALWVDYGVVFGSIPLVILVTLFGRLAVKVNNIHRASAAVCAAMGVVIVAAVHSLADFSLEIQGVTVIFVVIVAVGIACPSDVEQNNKNV